MMQWIVIGALWLSVLGVKKFNERKLKTTGESGTLCRSHCLGRFIPLWKECPRDNERDYCTGELWNGKKWVPSNEPIEKDNGRGGWCATNTFRLGDKCETHTVVK